MRIQSILYMRLYKLRKDGVMRNVKVRNILDMCQTVSLISPGSETVVWLLLLIDRILLIWEILISSNC